MAAAALAVTANLDELIWRDPPVWRGGKALGELIG